jgi:hypothetical protein
MPYSYIDNDHIQRLLGHDENSPRSVDASSCAEHRRDEKYCKGLAYRGEIKDVTVRMKRKRERVQ